MSGFFDDFLNNKTTKKEDQAFDSSVATGTFRLVHIPVVNLKPGGLRLFLMFYLMGMQNTPDKNTWKANQPSTEEFVIDFMFRDQTALLTVEISNERGVTVDRIGSSPSTQYLMQEAVVINGILDELHQCATEQSVPEMDRLLVMKDIGSIDEARNSLSFG